MSKRALLITFFILLAVLHQDSWWKDDARLVLGVLPVSLAYHVVWTLAVALAWWLVTKFFWPIDQTPVASETPHSERTSPAAR